MCHMIDTEACHLPLCSAIFSLIMADDNTSNEDYINMLDGDMNVNGDKNTDIDFESRDDVMTPTQEIIECMKTRHSLHILSDKLRFQRDTNSNSVCFNINFKPVLGNNYESLNGKLTDVVTKHRHDLIDGLLAVIDTETQTQTQALSKNYKEKISEFNAKKADDSRSKFVDAIRKEKHDLEYKRVEAKSRLSQPNDYDDSHHRSVPHGRGGHASRGKIVHTRGRYHSIRGHPYSRRGRGVYKNYRHSHY